MSNFKHTLAIVPMLSILSISPMLLDTPQASRKLASNEALYTDPYGVCEDVDVCEEGNSYHQELQDQNADEAQVAVVATQKQEEKKEEKKPKAPVASKVKVEEKKPEAPVVAEVKVEEKKPEASVAAEVKVEEKKPEASVAAEVKVVEKDEDKKSEEKEEDKKEEDKKEEKKEVCEHEKKEVLSQEANKLAQDQNLIVQQMLMMNQMMISMFQQYQIHQMQQHLQYQGPVNQQAYQYAPQQTAGNWVYYPNGFNPNGMYPNQFSQPQVQTQATQNVPNGYYNWGLPQQNYFQNDPRMTPMQVNPGSFGQPALGYNMGLQNPTIQPPYQTSMI